MTILTEWSKNLQTNFDGKYILYSQQEIIYIYIYSFLTNDEPSKYLNEVS